MKSNKIYYNDSFAMITNSVVKIGHKVFSLKNVSSVEKTTEHRAKRFLISLAGYFGLGAIGATLAFATIIMFVIAERIKAVDEVTFILSIFTVWQFIFSIAAISCLLYGIVSLFLKRRVFLNITSGNDKLKVHLSDSEVDNIKNAIHCALIEDNDVGLIEENSVSNVPAEETVTKIY